MGKNECVNFLVVGAGYWGKNHIRLLHSLPRATLSLICDTDESLLAQQKSLYPDVEVTTSFAEAIQRPDIDAVIIVLPASLHYQYAKEALLAGKHVLVEKPLALRTKEAEELVAIAKTRNLQLMTGHIFEHNDVVMRIKSIIDSGDLGEIFYVFCQRLNLGRVRNDVDALWNLAPHDLSIVNFCLDQTPQRISARGFNHLKTPLVDMGYITIEYSKGAVVHIVNSWLSPEKVRKITIVGSNKMLVFDDVSTEMRLQIFEKGIANWADHKDFGEFQAKVRSGDLLIPHVTFSEPLMNQANNFIDGILYGTPLRGGGDSGLEVVRLLEKASQSMQQNGAVLLVNAEEKVAEYAE